MKKSLLSPTLRMFLFAMVLANIGSEMTGNFLPLYLQKLGADIGQIGLFFTIAAIAPLLLQILGGWLSDSLGRLKAIAIGSLAGVFSTWGIVLAPGWGWLLPFMFLGSFTRSLVGPSFRAFIAEESSEQNRGRVFGMADTIFMVVAVIGPPLGGWLVEGFSFRLMFAVSAGLYTVATAVRLVMARRSEHKAARALDPVGGIEAAAARELAEGALSVLPPRPAEETSALNFASLKSNLGAMFALLTAGGIITWILITDGIRDVTGSLSYQLMPVYLNQIGKLGPAQIGWLGSIFGLTMMLLTTPAGWLADRFGERKIISLGFVVNSVALTLFLVVPRGFFGYAAVWALFGVGDALLSPAYSSLISKAVPERLRGIAFGLFGTSVGLISLPAPWIGGQLWERSAPWVPFAVTAFASLLAVVPVWFRFHLLESPVAQSERGLVSAD